MVAELIGIIPKQGFEVCRDAIFNIISTELTAQKILQGNTLFPESVIVYLESLSPGDSAEFITMNVMLASANYSQMTQADAQGKTMYMIDFYVSGKDSGDSAFRLQRFLGMVGYIFRSAQYRMLGLPAGLIGGTYVESFTIGETKKEDSGYSSFAQMQLAVRIQEQAQGWQGVAFEQNNSSAKLELTEKGYRYVFNN